MTQSSDPEPTRNKLHFTLLTCSEDQTCKLGKNVTELIQALDFPAALAALDQITPQDEQDKFLHLVTKGELLLASKEFDEAANLLERACKSKRVPPNTWKNYGVAELNARRPERAAVAFKQAYEAQPGMDNLLGLYMTALDLIGQYAEMAKVMEQWLATQTPTAKDHFDLAGLYHRISDVEKAEKHYKRSIELEETPQALFNYAGLIDRVGDHTRAIKLTRRAIELAPANAMYKTNLGCQLINLLNVDEGLDVMYKSIENNQPGELIAQEGSIMFYEHYRTHFSRQDIYNQARAWGEKHFDPANFRSDHANTPAPNRRLRIGYLSADFHAHSVSYFFESLLDGMNPACVEVFLYSDTRTEDHVTARFRSKAHHFHRIVDASDAEVEQIILDDQIDILVDLAGHTTGNRQSLLARKPAPIQCTWCGHPDTVGNPAIDYRITDALADPPETEQFHVEELAYLPDSFLCYRPQPAAPMVGPLPAEKNGYITFGSFNNGSKMTPLVRGLWAQVLQAVPDSRMLIKTRAIRDKTVCERLLEDFEKLNIDRNRIRLMPMLDQSAHLNQYNQVDIALDSYPYNGTTTTCEALWMGVPVISLCGDVHCSRVGYTLLSNADLELFVATNPHEFINKADALANNVQALSTIRQTMRRRMAASPICNPPRFAHNMEMLYRSMWYRWCEETHGVEIPDEAPAELTRSHAPTETINYQPPCHRQPDPDKPTVRLLHNLPRSGGTLFSKCVGVMNDVVLLSEIHPQGTAMFNPLNQFHHWYKLFDQDEVEKLQDEAERLSFAEAIRLIEQRCNEKDKTLVLRDWAHLDFIAVPFLPIPSNRLGLADALQDRFNIEQACLVRHPIDTWLSLRKLQVVAGRLDEKTFLKGYLHFARWAREIGFVRYEDFTADPTGQMQRFCDLLKMDCDESFINRWYTNKNITGDTSGSRGSEMKEIKSLPRGLVEPECIDAFRACDEFAEAMDQLGYDEQGVSPAAEEAMKAAS